MDHIFTTKEVGYYEIWLASRTGKKYISASCRLIEDVLDYRPGWRILDIGCGLGYHLNHLRKQGIIVHGLEAESTIARLASRTLGTNVAIDVGNAYNLPYEENSFEAVIMVNTLEFLDQPTQALAEAMRVAINRICLISLNPFSLVGTWWRLQNKYYPLAQGRALTLWNLRQLIQNVLGPVPQVWAGTNMWPVINVKPWYFASLIGVCAAVIPYYRTHPLTIKVSEYCHIVRLAHSYNLVPLY